MTNEEIRNIAVGDHVRLAVCEVTLIDEDDDEYPIRVRSAGGHTFWVGRQSIVAVNQPYAALRNWIAFAGRLFGRIYGDDRFADGTEVWTSDVLWMNPEETEALTANTHYRLENPQ